MKWMMMFGCEAADEIEALQMIKQKSRRIENWGVEWRADQPYVDLQEGLCISRAQRRTKSGFLSAASSGISRGPIDGNGSMKAWAAYLSKCRADIRGLREEAAVFFGLLNPRRAAIAQ
jgi:hypothetical protein